MAKVVNFLYFLFDFGDLLFMRRWYSPDFYNSGKVAQPLDAVKDYYIIRFYFDLNALRSARIELGIL